MRQKHLLFLLPPVLLACGARSAVIELAPPNEPPVQPQQPQMPVDPLTPIPNDPLAMSACEPSQIWSVARDRQSYGLYPERPRFSPNGALVTDSRAYYFGGTGYLRMNNGELVFAVEDDVQDRDRRWLNGLRVVDEKIVVETLIGRQRVFEEPATSQDGFSPGGLGRLALAPSGERLVVLNCGETDAFVDSVALPSGARGPRAVLGDACDPDWGFVGRRVNAIDEGTAIAITAHRVHVIDLRDGSVRSSSPFPSEQQSAIVEVEADPARSTLVLTTIDGLQHHLAFDDLTAIDDPRPSAVVTTNTGIYAPPLFASPLAWSPDGKLLASLDSEHHLLLEDVVSGETKIRIAPRTLPEGAFTQNGDDAPVSAAFSPNGRFLAVGFELGMALYGCSAPELTVETDARPVRLDGPRELRVGDKATFVATDLDGGDFHGHQFFLDGEPLGTASELRELEWTPETPGWHQIRVLLDDGKRQGQASLDVVVAG